MKPLKLPAERFWQRSSYDRTGSLPGMGPWVAAWFVSCVLGYSGAWRGVWFFFWLAAWIVWLWTKWWAARVACWGIAAGVMLAALAYLVSGLTVALRG